MPNMYAAGAMGEGAPAAGDVIADDAAQDAAVAAAAAARATAAATRFYQLTPWQLLQLRQPADSGCFSRDVGSVGGRVPRTPGPYDGGSVGGRAPGPSFTPGLGLRATGGAPVRSIPETPRHGRLTPGPFYQFGDTRVPATPAGLTGEPTGAFLHHHVFEWGSQVREELDRKKKELDAREELDRKKKELDAQVEITDVGGLMRAKKEGTLREVYVGGALEAVYVAEGTVMCAEWPAHSGNYYTINVLPDGVTEWQQLPRASAASAGAGASSHDSGAA